LSELILPCYEPRRRAKRERKSMGQIASELLAAAPGLSGPTAAGEFRRYDGIRVEDPFG
jgi:hypothetical protein